MPPTSTVKSRILKLDAVRGVAALMVVIGHCGGATIYGLTENPCFWWLSCVGDGASAVVMFFLLSGFVLALQLDGPNRPSYRGFLVRRFLRIWPAFALTLVLSLVALRWSGTLVDSGQPKVPPAMPGYPELLQNLLMVGSPYTVDPPVWSLYVEARLSVIFPLLLLLARRFSMGGAILASMLISLPLIRLVHSDLPDFFISLAEASRYMVLFVIGACLAKSENPVAVLLYGRLSRAAKVALLALAIACIVYQFCPFAPSLPGLGYLNWLGVVLLFVFCLYSKLAEGWLNRRPLLFLGKVSYGVYLVHYPLMLLLKQHVSSTWLTAVVLGLSIAAGWAINRWVEQPAIALGRRLH